VKLPRGDRYSWNKKEKTIEQLKARQLEILDLIPRNEGYYCEILRTELRVIDRKIAEKVYVHV